MNASIRIVEGWTHDNWNGGIDGHAIFLTIPQNLFLSILDDREQFENDICKDLNKLHSYQNEHFAEITIEMEKANAGDWRLESGALEIPKRTIAPQVTQRIWSPTGYRVFLSHKTEVKKETAALKEKLRLFGISAFVAHEDIMPTQEWQKEIEAALASMDAFVALLTKDFHESFWTDQEVGFAVARSVPVISIRLGRDPYGFIGKFQGLTCSWNDAPSEIVRLLIKHPRMIEAYIDELPHCSSFADGMELSKLLPEIETLSMTQADRMMIAYNQNADLNGCWGFHGQYRSDIYGKGLAYHLKRVTNLNYRNTSDKKIERA